VKSAIDDPIGAEPETQPGESSWVTPKWLEWVHLVWNIILGVAMLLIVPLAFVGLARSWMVVTLVAAGLPCALLNHILAEREGRELTPE
jgi:hypothetical protein